MKLNFTNGFGNKGKVENKEIEVKGDCVITNYDSRFRHHGRTGDLTITVIGDNVEIKGDNQSKDCVKLNQNKYSVFMAIAGMEENEDNKSNTPVEPVELTLKDLELARVKGLEKIKAVLRENALTFKEIAFDSNEGILRINYINSNGTEEVLRIDIETESEHNAKALPAQISILGESGVKMSTELFEGKTISKKDLPSQLAKLFNIYNKNNEGASRDVLDENELKDLYSDVCSMDTFDRNKNTQKDQIIRPFEIKGGLASKESDDKISVNEFLKFIDYVVNISEAKDIASSMKQKGKNTQNLLDNITTDNVNLFIKEYNSANGRTIFKDIYDDVDRNTRENLLNSLKNLVLMRAEECGVEQEKIDKFNKDYVRIVKSDMRKSKKASVLNDYVNKFIESFSDKEKLYNENKECIINMLGGERAATINGHKNGRPNEKLCFSTDDLNVVIKNIMKYAQQNNPKDFIIENSKSDNKKVSELAQQVIDSKFLDYYPVFVASIIAEETQFRETNNEHGKIYTSNGRGAMQLTKAISDDIFKNPNFFDKEFVLRIKNNYSDSTNLYNALKEPSNIELSYEVGTGALRSKVYYIFKHIKKNNCEVTIDSPTKFMQAMAMYYNGNKEVYKGATQPKKYEYCENVIQRFKQFTPSEIKVEGFYKYNKT